MCGRYTLHADAEQIIRRFLIGRGPGGLAPRFNVAPTQEIGVIRFREGQREIVPMRWGLIPSWATDPAVGQRMINARAETLSGKPSFRNALRHRRCIIPADGFYEWRKDPGGRTPIYLRPRDGRTFALAGLWDTWISPGGEALDSFTIITTAANDLVATLHDRMPAILRPADETLWLDPAVTDPAIVEPLLATYPAAEMVAHPVSTRVNSPRFDDPACIDPAPEAAGPGVHENRSRAGDRSRPQPTLFD
jgi:putative SOS response-associated peptidase YedK